MQPSYQKSYFFRFIPISVMAFLGHFLFTLFSAATRSLNNRGILGPGL